jgi:hypothetical protein
MEDIVAPTGAEAPISHIDDDTIVTDYIVAKKLLQLGQSAKSRNLDFDLKFSTIRRLLLVKKCFYTGKVFEHTGPLSRSIDRVDSSLGYVEGNVVACTIHINLKKADLSMEDITLLAKNIQKHATRKR